MSLIKRKYNAITIRMKETKISYLNDEMIIEDKHAVFSMPYRDIFHITYNGGYTSVFSDKNGEIWICQSLNKIMKKLPADVFSICNRNTIINLSHVVLINSSKQSFLQLDCNHIQIKISRRRLKEIKEKFVSLKSAINEST
jgi:DNA-binding LytR/AlgR family response regulator